MDMNEKIQDIISKGNGLENFAFVFFAYIESLYKVLVSREIKKILFISREGLFLKRLFDIYISASKTREEKIESVYFMVSRKSSTLAGLKGLRDEDFAEAEFLKSAYLLLNMVGYPKADIEFICKKYHIDPYKRSEFFVGSDEFNVLINESKFGKRYEERISNQREYLKEYIIKTVPGFESEGIFVADVGWRGTIQDNLYRLFNKKVEVTGFYLGLCVDSYMSDNNRKKGLLFRYSEKPMINRLQNQRKLRVYGQNLLLYEYLLMAPHGSVCGYKKENSKVIPVFEHNQGELDAYKKIVGAIQNSIISRYKQLVSLFYKEKMTYAEYERTFLKVHLKLLNKENKQKFSEIRDVLYERDSHE